MTITVYSKPQCPQCDATYRALDKKGLTYSVVDLTQDPLAFEMVQALGYRQAPVVIAGDKHWAGFRPDQIAAVARQAVPVLV
ncbi:MAG: glutaredoxin-like protein NrdH [Promicromonosporaceae bacterium]|nr:glutaredoxin-like protein NrdH [Promicromonosporaceae bacterium]